MKAQVLVRKGNPETAFELREIEKPTPSQNQVLIKVEAFGLNFADVMARQGLYGDAPPMPSVLGYDVVGRVVEVGELASAIKVGQRVVALTRFGGYAEFVATHFRAVVPVSEEISVGIAVAFATQYITAFFCAEEVVKLHEGDHVLIHAAAGGVGTALVQLAKNKGCIIYGTASASKLKYLEEQGVHFPIDYQSNDFSAIVKKKVGGRGLDVVFDSIGGASVKKGYQLLGDGGRIVCYGGSSLLLAKGNIFKMIKTAIGFGWYSPIGMLKHSKSVCSVNMLHIADHRPELIQKCLQGVVDLYEKKLIKPIVGGEFPVHEIAKAHAFLESRTSVGKLVVKW